MDYFLFSSSFFIFLLYFPSFSSSGPLLYSVLPNFTASYFDFIDHSGAFLLSPNGTFKAAISNPKPQVHRYYFSVIHSSSNSIIWTAVTTKPMSDSTKLYLTHGGLYIADQSGNPIWSTPELDSSVSALELQESGNLVLIDSHNVSLWESFDYPTDTIVEGQRLLVGKSLSSFVSEDNLSLGDYRFVVTGNNAVLQWNGLSYWKLSMDTNAFKDSNAPASFLAVNRTGLYLVGNDGSTVVLQVVLDRSSISLPGCFCNRNSSESNFSVVSYLGLGDGVDYFANDFVEPVKKGIGLLECQDLCSKNCSCLVIFYGSSTGSCYLVQNQMGSLMSSTTRKRLHLGYIKTFVVDQGLNSTKTHQHNPSLTLILFPLSGSLLLLIFIVMGILWWRRRNRKKGVLVAKFGSRNSSSSELEIITIPGLPVRFDYSELATATDNFKTKIGSGGFGTVYKGIMPDNSIVAVKKITNVGVEGKKEFCTEIAIIGNVHHINLVKLKGFCVQGRQRFLVYEYMNRGSLDRTLFDEEPALEWPKRYEIALGTARGLSYLHGGCDHKIIHCDIKPENILLHENLQVKLTDFGLSKLLNPEQSCHMTTLRGTRGYLAPEWLTSSGISDRTDVYSYGMVLLEIVRGRRNCSLQTMHQNVENHSSGSELRQVYFPLFALEMHEQGKYLELADSRLEGRVGSKEVEKLVRIALCCVHGEPMLRPTMANVVSMLEGSLPLAEPNIESLNFLRVYGRRFMEASTTMLEDFNGHNEFILHHQVNDSTRKTSSYNSLPFISSQQLSEPR
ncbi:G-type lectin S-receptor-like serine/threonine-protein kinase At5g35370 [Carica papaya]|uniref:G-type lectin S-receptor-like serine/threonine-protein kinase At5g35370 n=1 Tax=Carica papaya TaxID=3649 RepID=UPI000B8CEECF|nr:G-type lectin S-receptor-like serine/threonine-protein kinase At5g35370 [Carica papaya]